MEIEDAESGLDEVEPWRLLETIKGRAALVTCLDAMALKNARDAPLTFIRKSISDFQWLCKASIVSDETLQSPFNLANPRFNRLTVSQFLDFCQLLRINFSYLPRFSKMRTNETAEFDANE